MSAAIVKQESRYLSSAIDDDIVVMRLDDGDFFEIAGSARAVWSLIDGERDRDAILAALHKQYGPDDQIAVDLDRFLAELRQAGLIA